MRSCGGLCGSLFFLPHFVPFEMAAVWGPFSGGLRCCSPCCLCGSPWCWGLLVFCCVCCSGQVKMHLSPGGSRVSPLGIWDVKSQGKSPGTLQPKSVCRKVVGDMQVAKVVFLLDKKQWR